MKAVEEFAARLFETPIDEEGAMEIALLVRRIAREEVASLSGLVLRRLQDMDAGAVDRGEFARIFGEALRDFSASESEPGA